MREAVQRVVTALTEAGVQTEVREFAASTRTAGDAANALGTTVGQIVKSLVFLAGERPILVLVSGGTAPTPPSSRRWQMPRSRGQPPTTCDALPATPSAACRRSRT